MLPARSGGSGRGPALDSTLRGPWHRGEGSPLQRIPPGFLVVAVLALLPACGSGSGGGAAGPAPAGDAPSSPPPFRNGSFEQGLAGWQAEGVRVIAAGRGAFHGTHALEFDPGESAGLRNGRARAELPTEPGRQYRLRFAYQTGFAQGGPRLSVTLGGDSPLDIVSSLSLVDPGSEREAPQRSAWLETSATFFAEGERTELALGPLSRWSGAVGWGRVWVDHVRVEPLERWRALGEDLELRATLPSEAVVGEELELTLNFFTRLQADRPTPFDQRPARWTGELRLASGDPAARLPESLVLRDQSRAVLALAFGTGGIQRVTLRVPGLPGFEATSNPVRVHSAPPAQRSSWGDLHVHTELGHSDWPGGDGELNYAFARDRADLDFAALSEHFGWGEVRGWMERLVPPTLAFERPGRFVTLLAVESASYQGHTNFYLAGADPLAMFDGRNPFANRDAQLANLRARGVDFLAIPHHFMLLDPVDWRTTDGAALRLAEIYSSHGSSEEAGAWWRHPEQLGNWYGDGQGARGHDFRAALARGHRLGAIGCSDSHTARPGLSGLTCLRAPELTRAALFAALRARDCYATSGERLLLEFELEGLSPDGPARASMGGELFLAPGTELAARVEVHASAAVEEIELVRDGVPVASAAPRALDVERRFPLGTFSGASTHVYARVRLANEHRAWSSPIWIDPAGRSNPALEPRDLGYDFAAGALALRPRNTGDAPATAVLRLFSSADEPSFADVPVSAFGEPTLLLRVEPVNAGALRLAAALYTPRHLGRTFSFSGELQLLDARGYRVVADPRSMLQDDGAGNLCWDELLGTLYLRNESHAGQITDFELLVETTAGTRLEVVPRVDGAPLESVWVGSVEHPAPLALALPLGALAFTPPIAERTLAIPPGGAAGPVVLSGLPPGATYIAVLDPQGAPESDEDDDSALLAVPEEPVPYRHWPDFPR